MCIETRLREIESHLAVVVRYGLHQIHDNIDRDHIIDAHTEALCALRELRNAPVAALVEPIPQERANA
jgi:hypothetical protein